MSDISKAISTVFPDDKAHGFALLVPDKSSCETAMILFVQEIWSTFGMGEFLLPFFIYLFFLLFSFSRSAASGLEIRGRISFRCMGNKIIKLEIRL